MNDNVTGANAHPGSVSFEGRTTEDSYPFSSAVFVLASVAALTSSWSAIRILDFTIADFCLIVAALLAVGAGGLGRLGIRAWMIWPALLAFFLMARDVIIFDRPLNGAEDEIVGISPLQMLLRITLSTICVAIVCAGVAHRGRAGLKVVLGFWLAGIGISALWVLAQGAGLVSPSTSLLQLNGNSRFAGLTSHPNAMAQALVLGLPLLLLAPSRKSVPGLVGRIAILAVWGYGLFQTGSRAGLLVGFFAILLSVGFLAARLKALRWALPLLFLAVAAAVIYGRGLLQSTRFAADSGSTVSNDLRAQSVADGWTAFLSHPLAGAGLGLWVGELAPLVMLVSGGALFVVAYSVFILKPIMFMRSLKGDPVVLACLIAAALVPVLGLLNNGFTERYTFWPAFVGYALSLVSGASTPDSRRDVRE